MFFNLLSHLLVLPVNIKLLTFLRPTAVTNAVHQTLNFLKEFRFILVILLIPCNVVKRFKDLALQIPFTNCFWGESAHCFELVILQCLGGLDVQMLV
jgi:hypothetical protein